MKLVSPCRTVTAPEPEEVGGGDGWVVEFDGPQHYLEGFAGTIFVFLRVQLRMSCAVQCVILLKSVCHFIEVESGVPFGMVDASCGS